MGKGQSWNWNTRVNQLGKACKGPYHGGKNFRSEHEGKKGGKDKDKGGRHDSRLSWNCGAGALCPKNLSKGHASWRKCMNMLNCTHGAKPKESERKQWKEVMRKHNRRKLNKEVHISLLSIECQERLDEHQGDQVHRSYRPRHA